MNKNKQQNIKGKLKKRPQKIKEYKTAKEMMEIELKLVA